MKVKYSREVDILKVWLSDDPFDYAEESAGVITHSVGGRKAGPAGDSRSQGFYTQFRHQYGKR